MSVSGVQEASPRQWAGLVGVHLSIPLALPVSGEDYRWVQAWCYSLLFLTAGLGGRMVAERPRWKIRP